MHEFHHLVGDNRLTAPDVRLLGVVWLVELEAQLLVDANGEAWNLVRDNGDRLAGSNRVAAQQLNRDARSRRAFGPAGPFRLGERHGLFPQLRATFPES
jgi:hypothetical protein